MPTDVMLRDQWFAAPDAFSRSVDATQVLRATDMVVADGYEAQLLELDGVHYRGLSLRGARLLPPPRPEDFIDDEDEVAEEAEAVAEATAGWLMRLHRRIESWLLQRSSGA